eukprot:10172252-Ditylum_brightwellii.AAC.1
MKNMYNNYADDMKNMYNNHPNTNTSSITNGNESKKKNNNDRELNLAAKQQAKIAKQWRKEVCTPSHEDLVCHHISDGEVVIPPNARFGAHEGDWKRLAFIDDEIWQNDIWTRLKWVVPSPKEINASLITTDHLAFLVRNIPIWKPLSPFWKEPLFVSGKDILHLKYHSVIPINSPTQMSLLPMNT